MTGYIIEAAADLDPEYKVFFEAFYELSDVPPIDGGTAERYAARFTNDATFNLAGKVAKGTKEIIKVRESMWDKVASRKHTTEKIFSLGRHSNEVMMYGSVQYTTKDGAADRKEWAGRAVMEREDEEVKLKYYQIYM